MGELAKWSQWVRDNGDKFFLLGGIGMLLAYDLHILHDRTDMSQVQFINGLINNLAGALLTLITGAIMRKNSSIVTSVDEHHGSTAVTQKEE